MGAKRRTNDPAQAGVRLAVASRRCNEKMSVQGRDRRIDPVLPGLDTDIGNTPSRAGNHGPGNKRPWARAGRR